MPTDLTRNPFRRWLYHEALDVMASRLHVTKTTIREWRTGRAYPHPLRHDQLIDAANFNGFRVTKRHLMRDAK